MKRHLVEQNTEEWMELRKGKFTASSFSDLFMKPTTATYQKAIYRVVYERLTGEQPESFTNEYMERGHELEPLAREAYELETFNTIEEPGFFEFNPWIGASPDGLIGEDGLIEIKSPAFNTMINYMLEQKLPTQYKWQVYGQMYVTGRKWTDFMAYHPKLKPVIVRVERDEEIITQLDQQLKASIKQAKEIIKKIK
jgi:putative phage-type endonuclease